MGRFTGASMTETEFTIIGVVNSVALCTRSQRYLGYLRTVLFTVLVKEDGKTEESTEPASTLVN
jgi:hypothetical protein